jgi:hypothetical protein
MPNKLDVFDFDQTLFRSPMDTPENKAFFEKETGVPWLVDKTQSTVLSKKLGRFVPIRRGWYGRAETLLPPFVPDPVPQSMYIDHVVQALHESKANPDTLTLILTGRHAGLQNMILRILHQGNVVKIHPTESQKGQTFYQVVDQDVTVLFLGMDGPQPKGVKPNQTFDWKVWILDQYVATYPDIETVEIWEDRIEHVKGFLELDGILAKNVIVNTVVA